MLPQNSREEIFLAGIVSFLIEGGEVQISVSSIDKSILVSQEPPTVKYGDLEAKTEIAKLVDFVKSFP